MFAAMWMNALAPVQCAVTAHAKIYQDLTRVTAMRDSSRALIMIV